MHVGELLQIFVAVAVLICAVTLVGWLWATSRSKRLYEQLVTYKAMDQGSSQIQASPSSANNAKLPKQPPNYSHLRAASLMSENEKRFFKLLENALPDYYVFPQVALSGILQPIEGLSFADHNRIFRSYSQFRLDYVVCSRHDMSIIANIELDDRSHNAEKDTRRDKFLTSVGYKVHRFSLRELPSEAQILSLIEPQKQYASQF